MPVRVHGLEASPGDTAFAFMVLRLATPVDRAGLVALIEQLAPLVSEAERLVAELPDDCEAAMRLVGLPWTPPDTGPVLDAQRRMIEGATVHGIEEAWFFQTSTRLPELDDEMDEEDDGDEDGDDDDRGGWSHGPPPQAMQARFPVDNYPAILETLDWEDVGIAFKLAGPWTQGESTVLAGFHAMWLAPYGGRFRNAAVTVDQHHHAAHLWVDRFAIPCAPAEQVHHLLWIVSKLDEVIPVVHACFRGATMAQKYGGLVGDTADPFVLGGNPLLATHRAGGESAVDAWLATQTDWSGEEAAQMLRELSVAIVTRSEDSRETESLSEDEIDTADATANDSLDVTLDEQPAARDRRRHANDRNDGDRGHGTDDGWDAPDQAAGGDGRDDRGDDGDDGEGNGDGGDDDGSDDDGDDAAGNGGDDDGDHDDGGDDDGGEDDAGDDARRGHDREELRARSRDLTTYTGQLLAARARAGALDPRAAGALRPVLDVAHKYENRRIAVSAVLGALRDRESVPSLIRILDVTRIASALDAVGKEELLAAAAAALGAIGDPAAIPALSRLVGAPGRFNDEPRAAAAAALVACADGAPDRAEIDDGVFEAIARSMDMPHDDEYVAEMHLAYGALARTLPAERRAAARQRLVELELELDAGGIAMLARRAALVIASGDAPEGDTAATLRARVHAALRDPGYDHDAAIRNLRIVLALAARLPRLVDAADLVWLTRLAEPDVRARAHELLEVAGHPMPPAAAFDRRAARRLSDGDLVRWIGEPHVVGRAALVVEAGRRKLGAARAAIVRAAHAAIDRARPGGPELLDPDTRLLETSVAALLDGPLDDGTIALFERMLRHANPHVKWELLQAPPRDRRLIGGMMHVLGEAWGWQEIAAKNWLGSYTSVASNALARSGAVPARTAGPRDDADVDDDEDADETADDDESGDDDSADDDASDDDGHIN